MFNIPGRALLHVEKLKKYFPIKEGIISRVVANVKAVDKVSFHINEGETFGVVGESGCGKSTMGLSILRLIEPTSGRILFDMPSETMIEIEELQNTREEMNQEEYKEKMNALLNQYDVRTKTKKEMLELRRNMQIVFQDPYGALNPRMSVKNNISIILKTHFKEMSQMERNEKAADLLESCGLSRKYLLNFPHQLSGGQLQRACVARALTVNPRFIMLDEPTSALDVSVQAQILDLLRTLQKDLNLTYMFISHDLSVVQYISDRIAVMYLGNIVEMGPTNEIFKNMKHPYTKALIEALPVADPDIKKETKFLGGLVPSPLNPPPGCKFHTRCPMVMEKCTREVPPLTNLGNDHIVACHLITNET